MSGRTVTFELPVDSSQFTPLQLQPRSAFWFAMSGWAHWVREHWVPFPRLIRDHRLGVVISSLDLEYLQPFGFFDADAISATVGLKVRPDGALLYLTLELRPAAGGTEVARVIAVLRPVRIADTTALSAAPANLGPDELARFHMSELDGAARTRLPVFVAALEAEHDPIAVATQTVAIHRGICETADQWSAIALPDFAGIARERLVTTHGGPALMVGLSEPMRAMTMEFRRPGFFLDEVSVECRAYSETDETVFVHRISSTSGDEQLATFVEWFPSSTRTRE